MIRLMLTLLLASGLTVSQTPDGLRFEAVPVRAMDDWGDYDDWDIDDWVDWAEDYDGDIDVNVWDESDDFFENADSDVIDDVLDSLDEMDYDDDYIEDIADEFWESNEDYRDYLEEERERILDEIRDEQSNGEYHPYYYDVQTQTLYTSEGTAIPHEGSDFNGHDLYRDDNHNSIPDIAEKGVIGEGGEKTGGTQPVGGNNGDNGDDDDGGGYWDDETGGGTQNPPLNPYAKAQSIFRNSHMTDANWQVIENMLDKIVQDCPGNALYNGLLQKLDGKKLVIEFIAGSGSFFRLEESKIMIGMDMIESNVLFHEMFHAYQAYGETPETWQSTLLNGEIEARYAQYLYLRNLPEYSQPPWSQYTTDPVWEAIEDLTGVIDEKGNLLPGVTEQDFRSRYLNGPVLQLQTHPCYEEYHSYPFDDTKNSSQNFKNLKTLSGGC